MDTKPAQNIQDSFLNTARKDKAPITVYLLSGVKLTGRIRSFDKYSVVLESNNQEQLIFKHAISTVVLGKGVHHAPMAANERSGASPQSASASGAPSATGTTGSEQ
jgi:host factor-I protein